MTNKYSLQGCNTSGKWVLLGMHFRCSYRKQCVSICQKCLLKNCINIAGLSMLKIVE